MQVCYACGCIYLIKNSFFVETVIFGKKNHTDSKLLNGSVNYSLNEHYDCALFMIELRKPFKFLNLSWDNKQDEELKLKFECKELELKCLKFKCQINLC